MKKGLISLGLATSVAITGCNNTGNSDVTQIEPETKENVIKTQENVIKLVDGECYYFENISGNTPKNAILYPIGVECTQKTEGIANINGNINFSRSVTFKDPSSGKIIKGEVESGVEEMFYSLSNTNIDDKVKKSYKNKAERKINVINGKLVSKASPEGTTEGGDEEVVKVCDNIEEKCNYNEKQNNKVALQRIEKTMEKISNITGKNTEDLNAKIEKSYGIEYFSNEDIGILTKIGLKYFGKNANGDGVDVITKVISLYNKYIELTPEEKAKQSIKLTLEEEAELDRVIGNKRKVEISINVTGEGINSNVDVSKWNYLYHLLLGTGLFGGLLMTKNGKELRKKISTIFKKQKKTSK